MGVPRARRTKSKQGHRRSHLALKKRVLTKCVQCATPVLPHTVCYNCGYYKGRQVVKIKDKKSKVVKNK
ncbi:MAG: 50S ribosomal protein L32 [Parcubacteria group bacterium]|nr:50S ribosomal protein L32 [Parcubacteria group bacterium]